MTWSLLGSKVLLFVREFKKDLTGAAPYTYLGTAKYVSHYGSRPMSITWHLDHPILAKYIKKTSKADVGQALNLYWGKEIESKFWLQLGVGCSFSFGKRNKANFFRISELARLAAKVEIIKIFCYNTSHCIFT